MSENTGPNDKIPEIDTGTKTYTLTGGDEIDGTNLSGCVSLTLSLMKRFDVVEGNHFKFATLEGLAPRLPGLDDDGTVTLTDDEMAHLLMCAQIGKLYILSKQTWEGPTEMRAVMLDSLEKWSLKVIEMIDDAATLLIVMNDGLDAIRKGMAQEYGNGGHQGVVKA